ncbi:hypothetical protein A2U01_0077893, partial [Trifolium medium]|nr:hypothetical protein [Trifolium medium]
HTEQKQNTTNRNRTRTNRTETETKTTNLAGTGKHIRRRNKTAMKTDEGRAHTERTAEDDAEPETHRPTVL